MRIFKIKKSLGIFKKFLRTVLTARSDFFSGLFCDHFGEQDSSSKIFPLQGISENALDCLALYVYCEKISEHLEADDHEELLHLSDFYMLPGLKKVLASSMAKLLTIDNCISWLLRGKISLLIMISIICTFLAQKMQCN